MTRLRHAAVITLVCAAALAAVAAQEAAPEIPEGLPYKPLKESTCYDCHKAWTPPLRDLIRLQAPEASGAPIGEEFAFAVAFQHSWAPKPQVPHLLFVSPRLDISQAPSLRFGGAPEPVVNGTTPNVIPIDPQDARTPQGSAANFSVPAGAVHLSWTVRPRDTSPTGPTLSLVIVTPTGNVTVQRAPGPGQAATRVYTADELQAIGAGNWTVGAEVTPLEINPQAPSLPQLDRVEYEIVQDARFDTASLTSVAYPKIVYSPSGVPVLQEWQLVFVSEPQEGETVGISFDTVAWYKHKSPVAGGDFGGILHSWNGTVSSADGQPAIRFEAAGVIERPRPVNGLTVTKFSEVLGYAAAFLFVSSIVSGGMFGQASRRGLNAVFHSAKRRVAFHNFLSYGLSVAALVHMVLFLVPMIPGEDGALHRPTEEFQWTLGIIWGSIAMLAMVGLGLTGALQVPMIRRWSYPAWRWWHYGLTVVAILFTIVHMVLDGNNFNSAFPQIKEVWEDPFFRPQGT